MRIENYNNNQMINKKIYQIYIIFNNYLCCLVVVKVSRRLDTLNMSMFCGRSKDLEKIEARLCCDEEHRHDSSRKLLVSPCVSVCIK